MKIIKVKVLQLKLKRESIKILKQSKVEISFKLKNINLINKTFQIEINKTLSINN